MGYFGLFCVTSQYALPILGENGSSRDSHRRNMDGWTDRLTNQLTDRGSYRGAMAHLKNCVTVCVYVCVCVSVTQTV